MLDSVESRIARLLPLADRRDSQVGRIAESLGRAIIEGHLEPGDELNSVELSKQFESSRTPVREALMLLEKQGLVEIAWHRVPRVARISIEEVRGIYRVRAALRSLVAESIAQEASDESITRLHDWYEPMNAAARSGNVDGYFWANVDFNEHLANAANNQPLKRILDSIGLRVLQFRHLSMSQSGRLQQSNADNGRLLRALQARDSRLAAALGQAIVLDGLAVIEASGWVGTPADPSADDVA